MFSLHFLSVIVSQGKMEKKRIFSKQSKKMGMYEIDFT